MNKYEELKNVCKDASWFLELTPEQRVEQLRTRGQFEDSDPDVPLTGKVRVLIAVDATVPIDNESEFGFSVALDKGIQEAIGGKWAIDNWGTWVQYLDGPAAGNII